MNPLQEAMDEDPKLRALFNQLVEHTSQDGGFVATYRRLEAALNSMCTYMIEEEP